MKISICDVCCKEKKKWVKSGWSISYRDGKGMRIRLDVCAEHQNFFKRCKDFTDANKKYRTLMFGGLGYET